SDCIGGAKVSKCVISRETRASPRQPSTQRIFQHCSLIELPINFFSCIETFDSHGTLTDKRAFRERLVLMKDKVVFVTGANGGLGTSVTSAFLQQGARVIGASRQITAADFPRSNFEPLATDFNKLDEIRRCVSKIIEHYGRLDVLVHVLGGF